MPKTSEMKESNFLKKEDIGRGLLVTITGCVKKNVAKEGAEPENKWCLTFAEVDKPLVLNSTNIQICEQITNSDDTDHWINHKIVLYVDPNVSYQGKLVGGVRVRRPKTQPPAVIHPSPTPAPPPMPPMRPVAVAAAAPIAAEEIFDVADDDIPF